MRIPGLKHLKQSARWFRSRLVFGALILGYHRVAHVPNDPFDICVTPEHFAQQLEVLRQYACPIHLQQLVLNLQSGTLPKRAVVLTFDDGYTDTLYQAKPLLELYRIPATVFVTTGYLGSEFWWDELERVVFSLATLPQQLSLGINGSHYLWKSADIPWANLEDKKAEAKLQLLQSLYQWLLPLTSRERSEAMAQLQAWAGARSDDQSHSRAMTANELVTLSQGGLIEIGAHTVTHPLLSKLSQAEQQVEIQQSKICLETLLRQPIWGFSYPNGSLSKETLAIVRAAGFNYACASFNDVVWRGSNHFQLPRFWIPNWNRKQFYRWIQWWL